MHHICPKCDRPLTRANSWHFCKKNYIGELLENKPESLEIIFQKLMKEVVNWEGVSASATKNCIVFIAAKTFLVVKVMKAELDLKFVLPEACDDFPIYKRAAYGKKVEHYIRLAEPNDLDGDVIRLLRRSYEYLHK